MSLSNHIEELKRKHKALKNKIVSSQNSLSKSNTDITIMKKRKLKIKEQIYKIQESYDQNLKALAIIFFIFLLKKTQPTLPVMRPGM